MKVCFTVSSLSFLLSCDYLAPMNHTGLFLSILGSDMAAGGIHYQYIPAVLGLLFPRAILIARIV